MFREEVYVTQEHDQWLKQEYFPIVAGVHRYPRYKNQRSVDTFVKAYLDENKIDEQPEWGLPVPNQEAAYKSMSKYAKDVLPLTTRQVRAINLAWEWTGLQFGPYMRGSRIRDVSEVILALDKSTSSGYPFNNQFPKKKELFENDPMIVEFLGEDWNRLMENEYSFCFTNSLKEEVRPAEKCAANKIRTFTAGAVDGTVHGNRLFADMNEKMNSGYLRSASGVGMSPLKGNWDKLYRKLNIFRNGYALDESEYDSSLRAYMMWGCARLRWQQYRPEDQTDDNLKRLKVYYRNLVNSLVITPEGVIVMKLGGNPSGSVNTINDNTLILYTLLSYAWIMLYDEDEEPSYAEFELNTSKILVGDDNTWTVSDWAHRFYNGKTVIDVWKDIGVVTTTDSLEPRPAQELDFLSAKTIFYKGMAIPIYDRTKLMTSLLYSETCSQSPAYTLLRAAALLQNGWTDHQFRRFCRDFISWLLDHFDEICHNDVDWIQAKSAILTDERLESLFTGEVLLYPQSYQEVQERSIKPDKRHMSQPVQGKKSRSRRGKGAKATRKQNNKNLAQKLGQQVLAQQASPKRGRKRGQRKRGVQGPPRSSNMQMGRALAGKGSTRNQTTNRKQMVIEEDEYIGEVTGAATAANFGTTGFPVNIGQAGTFPWGSGVVKNNFEKYEFDYLEFYFKREVSEFATNGTVGKVMLSFDSDAADGPPTTKQMVEDTDPHVDGMPCENIRLVIPNDILKRRKDAHFIRPAGLPGAADIKTYDVGNLFVSTQGLASNSAVVGELHVRYRVRVFIPILDAAMGAPANNSVSVFDSSALQTVVTATPTILLISGNIVNGLGVTNTNGSLLLPVGNYLIDYYGTVKDSAAEALSVLLNLQKNGASVGVNTVMIPTVTTNVSLGAAEQLSLAGNTFVSMNGTTDVLTLVVTATGAAGTLTAGGFVRITAI